MYMYSISCLVFKTVEADRKTDNTIQNKRYLKKEEYKYLGFDEVG